MQPNRFRLILLAGSVLALVSLACAAGVQPSPTATSSPAPPTLTHTPTATSTPGFPTSTSTPLASPTPRSSPTPIPSPTDVPPTATPAPGEVLLREDFSDPDSGWSDMEFDAGSVGYGDGYYFAETTDEGGMVWGTASQNYADVEIAVDVTQVEAPGNDNNAFGVMCRVQADDDSYLMRISGDGFYAIHRIVDGQFEALVDWETSAVINQGDALNRLRVVCEGSNLTFFVNGELLAEATDTIYTEGDIGLGATTYEAEQRTEIHFDNLVASVPDVE